MKTYPNSPTPHESNVLTLKILMKLFRLKGTDIARSCNVSKTYVSRLLSGDLRAGDAFWARLNQSLPALLEPTARHVFSLSDNTVKNANELLNRLQNSSSRTSDHPTAAVA